MIWRSRSVCCWVVGTACPGQRLSPDGRGGCRGTKARREPDRLAPDPASMQVAVIQSMPPAPSRGGAYSQCTLGSRSSRAGRALIPDYEVLGFGRRQCAPALRVDRMGPDNYWFGARPQILLDRLGAGVDAMIGRFRAAIARYPLSARISCLAWS